MNESAETQKPRGGRIRSRTAIRLVLEVFSIVLGVLLALAVSQWQEKRSNHERAGMALANVRAELQANLQLLEYIYPNNARVIEGIAKEQSDDNEDETVIPGVQMRSSAWQTLSTTGLANYIEYDILIELSQLYSMIDVYRQTAYSFISSTMNLAAVVTALDSSVDNERFSKNFLAYFQMLVQIESTLIEAHQKAIESIDSGPG
jgi:hypothetical protein